MKAVRFVLAAFGRGLWVVAYPFFAIAVLIWMATLEFCISPLLWLLLGQPGVRQVRAALRRAWNFLHWYDRIWSER
jgi:hypothetical protein